ncbi:MAG: IPTL-CTERM sorting domain-containing protein [Casimicrobiaceae bacterium]
MKQKWLDLCGSLVVVALMAVPQVSSAQVCIDPPPIGGAPAVSSAPVGWSVAQNSPDIIAGNGPWPGGGYTVSDISGNSTSGGTMGLFLSQPGYVESWQTTLTGLVAGTTYQVAVEWQQATLAQNGGGSLWSGGQLRLTVDGNSTDYTSTGTVAGDSWQPAVKVFTAIGPTANLVLGHAPSSLFGMVVADSGAACQIIGPPQVAATIPTLSEIALGALSLLLAVWGVVVLRNRRRNPGPMA